jgi:hypothetical protein
LDHSYFLMMDTEASDTLDHFISWW